MTRTKLTICLCLVALLVLAWAGTQLSEFTMHPPRRVAEAQFGEGAAAAEIRGADGARLRAWLFQPSKPSGDAVILLHGVADNRLGVAGYARMFLRHGYEVLTPDARAHGESGGELATFGIREADDLRRWAEWLRATRGSARVFGLGVSMGAAILLQAVAEEQRFCAVVAESPFSSFREIAYDRMGQPFGAGPWLGRLFLRPVVESGMLYARFKYGVDLERASPEEALPAVRTPVLLIHGGQDRNIPPRHSRRLRERSGGKIPLWEVPEAGHTGVFAARPQEYELRVTGWFGSFAIPCAPAGSTG